ncbi:Sulfurtransferase [Balamuthia mandrillaris]
MESVTPAASRPRHQLLVSSQWVEENINQVVVIDATWLMPPAAPHKVQIPGMRYTSAADLCVLFFDEMLSSFCVFAGVIFFDIEKVAEEGSTLPHMLCSASQFEEWMDAHHITNDDHILLYDHSDGRLVASARVWWNFYIFGHEKVSILEGGFQNWPKNITSVPARSSSASNSGKYKATFRPELVRSAEQMLTLLTNKDDVQVLDAREEERFYGRGDEPAYRNVPSGSIPGSVSLPMLALFTPSTTSEGGTILYLKDSSELKVEFEKRGIDLSKDIVCSCGSGVTACVEALALYLLGKEENVSVYDGSWTEWVRREDTPKQHLQQRNQ